MLRQVGVVVLLLLGSTSGSKVQHHHEDVLQSLLHDLDVNQDANDIEADAESDFTVEMYYKPPQNDDQVKPLRLPSKWTKSVDSNSGEPVSRLWGVPDTTATVGTLFSMAVPKDAFQGDIQHYQLKGLPSWLHWDGHRHMLEGVARPADRGHHYITIKAVGADGTKAKDVFSVDVTELSSKEISRAAGCSKKVDLTLASVVIEKSVGSMDAKTRVRTLRTISKFLGIKKVSLTSIVQDLDPLADDTAILTGPGSSSHSGHGEMAQIQWVVGCGGEISSSYQGTVDRAEATSNDGTLERAIKLPVIGWMVAQVHAKTRRVRRQTDYSGDYSTDYSVDDWNINYDDLEYGDKDNYDEEEYDYDYDEPVRVVPEQASPVFPDAPPATPYPAPESRPDYASSMRPVLIATPVYVPVKPTRVVNIEASPTVTRPYTTSYPDLKSSITTEPVDTIKATVPLTTSTTTEFNPTDIILPSHVTEMVYAETGVKNFPPVVSNPIPKITMTAGHVFRMVIPEDTFGDMEDGNSRNLNLVFKKSDGQNVGYASWIQFDSYKQEIYALPLEENIGHYSFYLEATDKENRSKMDTININVKQSKARNYNHKITNTFKLVKKADYGFEHQLDWQVKAVEKISALYDDEEVGNINIISIFDKPHQISWTDVSLIDPRSQSCPIDELKEIVQVLVKDEVDMEPNAKAKKAFEPEFVIKKVNVEYLRNCETYKTEPEIIIDEAIESFAAPEEEIENNPPDFINRIDSLNATQGVLFIKKIESDTCYDSEDGDTSKLRLRLLTDDPSEVHPKNWLQFDQEKKEFYGIPLESDVGSKKYILECADSGGKKANDEMRVNVRGRDASEDPLAEFQIVIKHMSHETFMGNSQRKKLLIERIAEALDDSTHNIVVKSLSHGSVIATWYNSLLVSEHHESCPSDEITEVSKKMLDDNGELLPSFKTALQPFAVTQGSIKPLGMCMGVYMPAHKPLEKIAEPVEENEGEDYLLNFIIPAIIIAIMLLLAAIIACCLYRRRRYGKMDMTDDHTFVSKGIPIIFAEELDDRSDPAKSPMLMKDEKQPLPPPEYTRGNTLPASTPPNGERVRPQSGDTPYQPPPPFTATNGASRNQRPNMTPSYRKPPTYVPP